MALSPGAHLLEFRLLFASTCWTRWRVGTKRNDSLVKYYGLKTFTRFSDNDQYTDSDSNNECNSSSKWPGFLVLKSSSGDLALKKLSPFAVRPQKASKDWGTPLSSRNALENCKQRVYSKQHDLWIDPCESSFTRHWNPVEPSAAVSCPACRKWRSRRNCRNRVFLRSSELQWIGTLRRPPPTLCLWPSTR